MNGARRAMLAAIACGLARPFAVAAARDRKRIALVNFGSPREWEPWVTEFRKALAGHGFIDGRDVEILLAGIEIENKGRGPEATASRIVQQVLPLGPDAIVTDGPVMPLCVQLATRTVPIVAQVSDPVAAGFANSLAKPGGNMTGLADGMAESSVKAMEVMRQLVPRALRVAVLSDSRPAGARAAAHYERAAKAVGLEPVMVLSKSDAELTGALRDLPGRKVQAAFWAFGATDPRPVASGALAARIPLMGPDGNWARLGCLAAYYGHEPAPEAGLAAIVAQVLRGARPGEIPFQLPRHFRLVLNRRTASRLAIEVPADLLLRADEVYE